MRQLRGVTGPLCAVVVLLGCGPVIGSGDTSGGGTGGGEAGGSASSGSEDASTGADTEDVDDCALVLSMDPDGAASPAVHDGQAFWSTLSGTIARSPLDVAASETLLTTDDAYVDLSLSGDQLLLTAADRVEQLDLSNSQSVVLAAEQNNPIRPFRLGTRTYWINAGSGILASRLMRLDAGAAEPTELLDGFGFPMGAGVDEGAYYFVAKDFANGGALDGAVLRFDDETDAITVLASPVFQPSGLAVAGERVVWLEQLDAMFSHPGRVRSVAKTGGPVTEHAVIDAGLGVMVAADAQAIVYSVFDSDVTQVHQIDLASESHTVLADFPGSTVVDIALAPDAIVLTTSWSDGAVEAGTPSVTRLCRE